MSSQVLSISPRDTSLAVGPQVDAWFVLFSVGIARHVAGAMLRLTHARELDEIQAAETRVGRHLVATASRADFFGRLDEAGRFEEVPMALLAAGRLAGSRAAKLSAMFAVHTPSLGAAVDREIARGSELLRELARIADAQGAPAPLRPDLTAALTDLLYDAELPPELCRLILDASRVFPSILGLAHASGRGDVPRWMVGELAAAFSKGALAALHIAAISSPDVDVDEALLPKAHRLDLDAAMRAHAAQRAEWAALPLTEAFPDDV